MNSPKKITTETIFVGELSIGAQAPLRVQSMINPRLSDISASVEQIQALVHEGSELIRLAVTRREDFEHIQTIRKALGNFKTPLVADVHFNPELALHALEYFEKVRINPGNFGEKPRQDWTKKQFESEKLQVAQRAKTFFLKANQIQRAVRIGVNRGSLSQRMLWRYGDSSEGMLASLKEWLEFAEEIRFHNLVISLKSSDLLEMIQVYRKASLEMKKQGKCYPLHLGVTEAGYGLEGRMKSSIGILTLLSEGIGDTIRVSLTEDPVTELKFTKKLAQYAQKTFGANPRNFFEKNTIMVSFKFSLPPKNASFALIEIPNLNTVPLEKQFGHPFPLEAIKVSLKTSQDVEDLGRLLTQNPKIKLLVFSSDSAPSQVLAFLQTADLKTSRKYYWSQDCAQAKIYSTFEAVVKDQSLGMVWENISNTEQIKSCFDKNIQQCFQVTRKKEACFDSEYSSLLEALDQISKQTLQETSLWIHYQAPTKEDLDENLLDFVGYLSSLNNDSLPLWLSTSKVPQDWSYHWLQTNGYRRWTAEFISCPSCSRTQFDIAAFTPKVKSAFQPLNGLKIAVMGCVVNGPGEMGNADFGFMGMNNGNLCLYEGPNCFQKNVSPEEAIALMQKHMKDLGIEGVA